MFCSFGNKSMLVDGMEERMKKMIKIISRVAVFGLLLGVCLKPCLAMADSEGKESYLVLGEDLKDSEKETVLKLLGVEDINDYNVSYTTHEDEVKYLGDYLSASVIGTRALSSVLITQAEENSGITITTTNINYCTQEMYRNALITAGVKDIDAKVAGPFSISGTAALVSMMKSYELMTGEELDETAMDVANNELVTTAELSDSIGSDKAAELVAALKQELFEDNGVTLKNIDDALDTLCENMDVSLSEEDKEKIVDLMAEIDKVDVDADAIKTQAAQLYDTIKNISSEIGDKQGVIDSIGNFFGNIINAIIDFFSNLFG
jgi:uncharacterized protein YpuA (DUF1002 family)